MTIAAVILGNDVVNVVVLDENDSLTEVATAHSADVALDVTQESQRPGPGWTYVDGQFRPPSPYPSWVWDGSAWSAPSPRPDGPYRWDEETLTWVELPPLS